MTPKNQKPSNAQVTQSEGITPLLGSLRQLIADSRQQVLRAVDVVQVLSVEFGRGFDATNLRHMRGFQLAFPIRDAVHRELSWTLSPSLRTRRRKCR